MRIPKFLIAENFNISEKCRFIVHTETPKCLIIAVKIKSDEYYGSIKDIFKIYEIKSERDISEKWELLVCQFYDDDLSELNDEKFNNYLPLLDLTWNWFSKFRNITRKD